MWAEVKELWNESPFFRYMSTVFVVGAIFLYQQSSTGNKAAPAPSSGASQPVNPTK